jgi:endoglucanase
MRKLVIALLFLGSVSMGQERDAAFWNAQIGRGVNLGNMLEAPAGTSWAGKPKEEYLTIIAEAGFDSVRIPIRWSDYAEESPPYTIDPRFYDEVDAVIKWALEHKLVAIINIHHYEEMNEAPAEHKARFLSLWRQIAARYRKAPNALMFEVLNEPNKNFTAALWNEYLVDALAIIRKTNPKRPVLIGSANWNSVEALQVLELPKLDKNLIATFHYYSPFEFTHQGASWAGEKSKTWLGREWTGTPEEQQAVRDQFDAAVRWAEANRVPLCMGEFGAFSEADMASRVRWTRFVREEAEARAISWSYWEFCSGFGIYDLQTSAWREDLFRALLPVSSD